MKSKFKKALSLALAGSMVAAMAINSFAISTENSLDYEVELQVPTIEVELTANTAIVMNPYGLTFINPVTNEEDTASLVTAVNVITSRTLVPLDVDVTVTSSAPDTVTWASSSAADTTNSKDVFLEFYLEAASDDDTTTPLSTASWTATSAADMLKKSKLATAKAAKITLDGSEQAMGEDDNYFVMPAATPGTNDEVEPTYAHFQLLGDLATKSEEAWSEEDVITTSVAFTFNMMTDSQLNA